MPAPFEMPGHYWDEARGKFFKIEKTGTAPTGAIWSQTAVNHRRKYASDKDVGSGSGSSSSNKRTRRNQGSSGSPVSFVPPPVIVRAPMMGRLSQLLARELGVYSHQSCSFSDGLSMLSSSLPSAPAAAIMGAAIVDSLCYSGQVTAMTPVPKNKVTCLYVYDEERVSGRDGPSPPGIGMMYTNYRHRSGGCDIKAHFIPREENDCIPRHWPVEGPLARFHHLDHTSPESFDVPEASAIAYHAPSRRMIVTSSRLTQGFPPLSSFLTGPGSHYNGGVCAYVFLPGAAAQEDSDTSMWPDHGEVDDPFATLQPPTWSVSTRAHRDVVQIFGRSQRDAVYACVAAPAAAANDTLCVLGSGRGLSLVRLSQLAWVPLAPPASVLGPSCCFLDAFETSQPPVSASASASTSTTRRNASESLVTSVDFFEGHPNLVLAGTRQPHPWLVDLREPEHQQWHALSGDSNVGGGGKPKKRKTKSKSRSTNAVAHVRSVGGHRVVSACLRDTMVLYDVRRAGTSTTAATAASAQSSSAPASSVVFSFDGYSNEARLFGHDFDVDPRLGLVAAGNDPKMSADGTRKESAGLSIFSLATGERLTTGPTRTSRQFSNSYTTAVQPSRSPSAVLSAEEEEEEEDEETLQYVSSLQFARLPGDAMPSLFVGSGPYVQKFSMGHLLSPEDEGIVDEPGYAPYYDLDEMHD